MLSCSVVQCCPVCAQPEAPESPPVVPSPSPVPITPSPSPSPKSVTPSPSPIVIATPSPGPKPVTPFPSPIVVVTPSPSPKPATPSPSPIVVVAPSPSPSPIINGKITGNEEEVQPPTPSPAPKKLVDDLTCGCARAPAAAVAVAQAIATTGVCGSKAGVVFTAPGVPQDKGHVHSLPSLISRSPAPACCAVVLLLQVAATALPARLWDRHLLRHLLWEADRHLLRPLPLLTPALLRR